MTQPKMRPELAAKCLELMYVQAANAYASSIVAGGVLVTLFAGHADPRLLAGFVIAYGAMIAVRHAMGRRRRTATGVARRRPLAGPRAHRDHDLRRPVGSLRRRPRRSGRSLSARRSGAHHRRAGVGRGRGLCGDTVGLPRLHCAGDAAARGLVAVAAAAGGETARRPGRGLAPCS